MIIKNDPSDESERSYLLNDINASKKCLEVYKIVSEVSTQKIYRVREVITDSDSDQVIVTTLADLFNVKKALSKDNLAQLVRSITEEALHHLTKKRYSSWFRALAQESDTNSATSTRLHLASKTRKGLKSYNRQSSRQRIRQSPLPNKVRKRSTIDRGEQDIG